MMVSESIVSLKYFLGLPTYLDVVEVFVQRNRRSTIVHSSSTEEALSSEDVLFEEAIQLSVNTHQLVIDTF